MRLVTVAEMRAVEEAGTALGVPPDALLVLAGSAVADRIANLHGRGRTGLVLVGKGNNGGDALVAAKRLAEVHAWRLSVCVTADRNVDDHLEAIASQELTARVDVVTVGVDATPAAISVLDAGLVGSDVVLDGILGIGATGILRADAGAVLARCALVPRPSGQARIAIDVPSGVNADTGRAAPGAFKATRTLSTGPAKPGCFVGDGSELAGRVDVLNIGLPEAAWPRRDKAGVPDDGSIRRIGSAEAFATLTPRPDQSHKGSFGRMLVIGGCTRYPGAPVLSSLGAIHGGAGVVSVARPRGAVGVALPPEVVALPLSRRKDAFDEGDVEAIIEASARMKSVVIGPGLGADRSTVAAVRATVGSLPTTTPIVIDADGLNALVGTMVARNAPWVVTPHVAEMSRLTGQAIEDILSDPVGIARDAAHAWGVVVVLKGAPTVVASPKGSVVISAYVNAALATAGSGDVLAGLIGALLAQGASPWRGAVAGVTLHAIAGELWRRDHGSSGARASDLASRIPGARAFVARMG